LTKALAGCHDQVLMFENRESAVAVPKMSEVTFTFINEFCAGENKTY